MEAEEDSLEQMQARHRKELKELQGRITGKKKNATKKTRKGVNDECAEMERQLREKQAGEIATLSGGRDSEQGLDGVEANGIDDVATEEASQADAPEAMAHNAESKLEGAVETLQISNDEDASQDGGGAGKKRNRHKERLARRAAEQSAAAQRAEDEASTMTDHRARESEYMRKTFEAHGLAEKEVQPDGHCLFSAVADQLGQQGIPLGRRNGGGDQSEPAYKLVRRAAAAHMTEHPDDFAPFLEEPLGQYVAKVRDTAEWGGQLELTALARRYGVEIRVIQDGRTERIGDEGEEGEDETAGKTLWLAYYRHGYGLGEHYNSLRKKKK